MVPSTTHINFHIFDCFIDGGNFGSSSIGNYLSMSNSYQGSSYSLSYLMMEYHYSSAGYGGGGVGTRTTHFYFYKVMLYLSG